MYISCAESYLPIFFIHHSVIHPLFSAQDKLSVLSASVTCRLYEDLESMSRDSRPELQDKAGELRKLIPVQQL